VSTDKETRLVYSTSSGDLRKDLKETAGAAPADPGKQKVRVSLDTKGRKGKPMTMISGIQHNPQVIEKLAKTLKNCCGAGGTVEAGNILIQGDHREKLTAHLHALGYKI
jgi:translation initiation factor 1